MTEALKIKLGVNASDSGQVVDFLYERLMGTLPTAEVKNLYVGWIQNQTYSIEGLAVYASNLSLNPVASDLVGLVTTGLFYIPVSTNG